jgi:hypothetical protein
VGVVGAPVRPGCSFGKITEGTLFGTVDPRTPETSADVVGKAIAGDAVTGVKLIGALLMGALLMGADETRC